MTLFADGLVFPECPRWHDDALWCVDMWAHTVLRFAPDGTAEVVHRFDDEDPGGIGWLPDGSLLVVGMEGRVVYRVADGTATVHADLREHSPAALNDMVVDADGTAYVTQFGYDLFGGGEFAMADLVRVGPDGAVDVVAGDMAVPNGAAIDEDGDRLFVAEPGAGRVAVFRLGPDGPTDRTENPLEPVPDAPYVAPDGICLDSAGGIWVADPMLHRVFRVEDGRTTDQIDTPGVHPTACVLGGPDRRTLYVTAAEEVSKAHRALGDTGRVLAFEVEVGGAGTP